VWAQTGVHRSTHNGQCPFDLRDFSFVYRFKVESRHLGSERGVKRPVRDILERRGGVDIRLDGRIGQLRAGHAMYGYHGGWSMSVQVLSKAESASHSETVRSNMTMSICVYMIGVRQTGPIRSPKSRTHVPVESQVIHEALLTASDATQGASQGALRGGIVSEADQSRSPMEWQTEWRVPVGVPRISPLAMLRASKQPARGLHLNPSICSRVLSTSRDSKSFVTGVTATKQVSRSR